MEKSLIMIRQEIVFFENRASPRGGGRIIGNGIFGARVIKNLAELRCDFFYPVD